MSSFTGVDATSGEFSLPFFGTMAGWPAKFRAGIFSCGMPRAGLFAPPNSSFGMAGMC
jgi:hypothetical protein